MNVVASFFLFYLVSASFPSQNIVTEPPVEVDSDREYDFSGLRTYAWSPDQQPAAEPADAIRLHEAISESLRELGFTHVEDEPEVEVVYRLAVERKRFHVDSLQRPSGWDLTDLETTVMFGGHEEARLVIEMYDASTGRRIWRAQCVHPQPTPDKVEKSLYQTVVHLFSTYPGKAPE